MLYSPYPLLIQYLDSNKIHKTAGWTAKTLLDKGLDQTISAYKNIL